MITRKRAQVEGGSDDDDNFLPPKRSSKVMDLEEATISLLEFLISNDNMEVVGNPCDELSYKLNVTCYN